MKHYEPLIGMAIGIVLLISSLAWGEGIKEPANKIVVIVDCSGSFKSQHQNAVKQTTALLDTLSQTKLKRWEGDTDEVVLICLDALPQVLWKGTIKALKASDLNSIAQLFSARKEFSLCTDVLGAFELALRNLEGDPRFFSKYLFVFSDLIHEPPTKSVTSCGRPVNVQGNDFPWHLLADISTTVFWMPANQQFVWKKAISNYELEDRFTMYSTGFSDRIDITPPPRPEEKISDQEREEKHQEVIAGLHRLGKWSAKALGFILGLFFFLGMVVFFFRRRFVRQMPVQHGSVPPLPIGVRPRQQRQQR